LTLEEKDWIPAFAEMIPAKQGFTGQAKKVGMTTTAG